MDCGGCVGVCPHDALELLGGYITVLDTCTECNLCVQLCPVDALEPAPQSPVKGLPRLAARR